MSSRRLAALVSCLVVALACLSTVPVAAAGGEPPAWLSYARPAQYTSVVADTQVPMRDGTELPCDLYRPGRDGAVAEGRFPGVVWQFHGYGVNRTGRDATHAAFLAERGYVVVQCSVRGTGGSPGEWSPLSPQEARDGYDIVEWLAAQPFSTGRVAMAGYSYGAITAYLTAALAPPHLVTIVPHSSYADAYRDIVRIGGIRGADVRGWVLGLILGLNAVGTPPDQQAALVARGQQVDAQWAAHPTYDAYWRRRSVDHAALRRTGIPILGYGGWYDLYQRGMPANFAALPEQTWLVMEPNPHVNASGSAFGSTAGGVLAWLDHWVARRRGAPLPSAKVTSYEMPRAGGGGWTELESWPPAPARVERLRFTSDGVLAGRAGPRGSATYTVDPFDGLPSYWNVGTRPDDELLRRWHTQREADRFHVTTPPLAQDLVLAGSVRAHVEASFTADDGYLVVRLTDVAPDGSGTLMATGWLQASHRDGHTAPRPVPVETRLGYDVEVWPVHWRLAEGHRLQVSISSGDVPRIHPDAPAGEVTVHTGRGGSYVDVPLLPR